MAQEIVRLCDPCLADDVRTNANGYTLGVDALTRVVDLCGEHADAIVKPLEALLARWGQPVDGAPATKRKYTRKTSTPAAPVAPVADVAAEPAEPAEPATVPTDDNPCPFCPNQYGSKSGLTGHLKGRNVPPPYALVGGRCPFDGAELPASGPGNLALHLFADHGVRSIAAGIVAARDAGTLDRRIGRKLARLQAVHDGDRSVESLGGR